MSEQQSRPASVLVTGAYGCIGAWVTRLLLAEGVPVVATDIGSSDHRLRRVLSDEQRERMTFERVDVTLAGDVAGVIDRYHVTSIIHLAGLQVPACQANPGLGATVNVAGTANVLTAARDAGLTDPVVYASSTAQYPDPRLDPADGTPRPATLYGIYKRAVEQLADVFFHDEGLPSIGIRPSSVYGPGRDFGLTAHPTFAAAAAAAGNGYHIPYGGSVQLQYVEDVAQAFINASRAAFRGAAVVDLVGHTVEVAQVSSLIEELADLPPGSITYGTEPIPVHVDVHQGHDEVFPAPDRPLAAGMAQTIEHFRRLPA